MYQFGMKWISTLSLVAMIAIALPLRAAEVSQFFSNARSLGMGRTSIAVVDDETALLTNPAGLGKVRDFYGTIIDPEVEGGVDLQQIYSAQKFSDPFNPGQINASLQASPDQHYHARAQLFPSIVVRNFGIGIFGRRMLDAQLSPDQTIMHTNYEDDLGLFLGYNLRLWDGIIKIGVTGKAISRIEINKDLPTTGPLDIASNASEGLGIGSDVGLTLAAPIMYLPTATAVVHDVGGTSFNAGSGLRMNTATRPATVPQDMDVAVAMFPIHSNHTRSTLTVEADKLREASQAIDKTRYLHAGYEFNYADVLFLRGGINQRYWTAGLEIASENTQFQLATYGEDVGVDGTPQEDRRLVLKFSLRF